MVLASADSALYYYYYHYHHPLHNLPHHHHNLPLNVLQNWFLDILCQLTFLNNLLGFFLNLCEKGS